MRLFVWLFCFFSVEEIHLQPSPPSSSSTHPRPSQFRRPASVSVPRTQPAFPVSPIRGSTARIPTAPSGLGTVRGSTQQQPDADLTPAQHKRALEKVRWQSRRKSVSDSVVLVVKGDGARAAVEGFEASTPHSFQITTLAVSLFRLLRMKCEELSAKKDWQMRSGSRYTPPNTPCGDFGRQCFEGQQHKLFDWH